tara:strand:+ start:932 stop:1150 length:219 start_codon:yes stop_codon:yes gene_type:complete
MNEIDLHGLTHNKVKEQLESELILEYNKGNFPIRVITGNSLLMKKILISAVDKQRFKMREDYPNSGASIIYE